MEGDNCCEKLYNRIRQGKCGKFFLFLVLGGLNVADLVSDWFLFHDVHAAEEGLVFGPPDKNIWISLLFFSILGTILFSFEILNLGKDIFTGTSWVDIDIMSAIIIWFEDIPQITINCAILACREEAISIFQISKASIVILGALIRMLVGIVRACRRRHSSNKSIEEFKQCNTFKFIMFFGLSLMVIGSVIVFFFAQSSFKDGTWEFKTPRTLWEGEYHDSKYFERVGVYGNLGFLDDKDATNAQQETKNPAHSYWMKFFQIYDIHHANDVITVVVTFDTINRSNFRIQTLFSDAAENNTDECFVVKQSDWSVSRDLNCTRLSQIRGSKENIKFTFSYVKPRNHLVFGDIQYNVRGTVNGTCLTSSELNVSPTEVKADKILSPNYEIVLRYFKAKEDYESGNLVQTKSDNVTFYDPQRHLVDITNVWKTGFLGCKITGSVSPHLNSGVSSSC
ncbi:hypothetical protein FSP39_003568 [Pinctada imbricata]|uniref:Uncharacterized protein n=1 Tax=Pinctada imbricata TaxID=66713 RepID=A0AA89BIN8_PINIB|nr:hypothetical protein FSP39_003568 [Pinctada imbricata]